MSVNRTPLYISCLCYRYFVIRQLHYVSVPVRLLFNGLLFKHGVSPSSATLSGGEMSGVCQSQYGEISDTQRQLSMMQTMMSRSAYFVVWLCRNVCCCLLPVFMTTATGRPSEQTSALAVYCTICDDVAACQDSRATHRTRESGKCHLLESFTTLCTVSQKNFPMANDKVGRFLRHSVETLA